MPFTPEQENEFEKLYAKASAFKDDNQLVAVVYSMISILDEGGEGYVTFMDPLHMGIHQANRGGKKMVANAMEKKGVKIYKVGFTFKLCGVNKAIAFEKNPNTNNCQKHTITITSSSPLFAKFVAEAIRGGSVGCSHLNQWLAAVKSGAQTTCEKLCEPSKINICTTLVTNTNKELAKAAYVGLEWFMIRWPIEVKYPQLPSLIQRALNVEHHVGEGESWDEQMLFTARKAKDNLKGKGSNKEPDWDHVQRAVAASEPPRLCDVPSHIKFLQKWGGGCSQHLVLESLEYIESRMPNDRIVNGNFLEKLASLKLAPSELMPRMVHACILLQAMGPKERECVGCTVTEAHVKSLQGANKAKGMQANTMLNKAHELVSAMSSMHDYIIPLGDMAIELAKYIFDVESEFESMEEISKKFVGQISGSEIEAAPSKLTDPEPSEETIKDVLEFSADGSNYAGQMAVRRAGFKVGSSIELKKPEHANADQQFEITYMNLDGSVGIREIFNDGSANETKVVAVPLAEFISKYKHCKSRLELLEGYPGNRAWDSVDLIDARAKGAIAFAMHELQSSEAGEFRCQSKPKERVFATKSADAQSMTIVPLTYKIEKFKPSTTIAATNNVIGNHTQNVEVRVDSNKYVLKRCVEKKCVGEFWLIRTTSLQADANLVMKDFKVPIVLSASTFNVIMPCAINKKNVKAGDELVLFKPAAQGGGSQETASKRARLG